MERIDLDYEGGVTISSGKKTYPPQGRTWWSWRDTSTIAISEYSYPRVSPQSCIIKDILHGMIGNEPDFNENNTFKEAGEIHGNH